MRKLVSVLDRIDRGVYRAEQAVAGALFFGMFAVMFVSVSHRVFSRGEGRLSTAILKLAQVAGLTPDPEFVHGPVSLGVNLLLTLLLSYVAVRTMKRRTLLPTPQAWALAVTLTAVLALLVWALLELLPSGLIWGPAVGLACLLWVGFLGASLATYEKKHLALEMAEKLWPQALQRPVRGLAMLVTGAACAFLLVLAWLSISDHYATWVRDPEAGHLLPTEIPRWTLLTVLPWTFAMMTLRFAGEGARILLGLEAPPPAEDLA